MAAITTMMREGDGQKGVAGERREKKASGGGREGEEGNPPP